jgi:uncharacterized protein (UPF0264 family)
MTKLLVSVRSEEEACEALAGGAHIIDAKEPAHGPLGMPTGEQLLAIRRAVRDQVPLSAACGELLDDASRDRVAALHGYAWAKVGLSGCIRMADWPQRWARCATRLPEGMSLVAVAYSDQRVAGSPSPAEIIGVAAQLGCRWLLVDTFDKSRGDLFAHLSPAELVNVISLARRAGVRVALAGSLNLDSIPRAMALCPDVIGVRGAACLGGRNGRVARELVTRIARQLSTPQATRLARTMTKSVDDVMMWP